MNYSPSSPSGTSSSASTTPSSSSSEPLVTPSPSPILFDSLSLSPSLPSPAAQPPQPPMHVVTVCNAPLVAPIPLPYHSPTFLQFDLPDEDADLSKPPYTRKSSPSASPPTGKRKRTEHESDSLPSTSMSVSLAQRLDSMLLLPPPLSYQLSASSGAPAAKRRRSFPAPFWHTGPTTSLNPPSGSFHTGAKPSTTHNSSSAHVMLRSNYHHHQQQRALRHAISYSHSLHHKQPTSPRRLPEIPTTTSTASSRNSASSFLFPFPSAQLQPTQPIHQSCSTVFATAPSNFGSANGVGSMNISGFDHSYPYHLR